MAVARVGALADEFDGFSRREIAVPEDHRDLRVQRQEQVENRFPFMLRRAARDQDAIDGSGSNGCGSFGESGDAGQSETWRQDLLAGNLTGIVSVNQPENALHWHRALCRTVSKQWDDALHL